MTAQELENINRKNLLQPSIACYKKFYTRIFSSIILKDCLRE